MTCRHVVDINQKDGQTLVVVDKEQVVPIEEIKYPQRPGLDIAFIPNALRRPKREFFPILSPERIIMGEDVYSVGFYVSGEGIKAGYFRATS